MKFSALSYISALALGVLSAGLTSCSDEIVAPVTDGEQLRAGGINFRCADMLEVNYGAARTVSRAGASKNPDEKAIHTLHVFFFNPDGDHELLIPTYDNQDLKSYTYIEDGGFLTLPETAGTKSLFKDKDGNEVDEVLVVALANIDATDDADDAKGEANRFFTDYSENGKIQRESRAAGGDPHKIEKLSDLEEWVYYPRMRMDDQTGEGDIQGLPEAGMPMICPGQKITLQKGSNNSDNDEYDLVVNMVAMMAKVNVTVELDPDQQTSQYPILEITEYGVRNMPVAVPFKAPTGEAFKGTPTGANLKAALGGAGKFDTCKELFDITDEPMYHKGGTGMASSSDSGEGCNPLDHEFVTTLKTPRIINKDSAPVRFTYYTYENINVPDYAAERANGDDAFEVGTGANAEYGLVPSYPPGVEGFPEEYQRWKSTMAYSYRASALVLKGRYTNHQGMRYNAQFTVYLGSDADKNFMVKRNHQYDNAITIRGLEYIRNSTDDVFTFDGRVNVVDDNPFYLAIVNERNVDAHASALPMDVWLMYREPAPGQIEAPKVDFYSEVTIKLPNLDNKGKDPRDWIQMVMIPRAEMEAGGFKAGTGCEPYFYDKMIDDIKNKSVLTPNTMVTGGIGYPGHHKDAQCGDEIVITSEPGEKGGAVNNSRARVYFYIDENTNIDDDAAEKMLDNPAYMDRSVIVDVIYRRYTKDSNGVETTLETRPRTLEIEQRGLRRVQATWPGDDNAEGKTIPETYIEYTEEYLAHNDPLEPHASGEFYPGLEWGLNGKWVNYCSNHTEGFVNNFDKADGHTNNGNATNPANGYVYNIYKKNSAFAFTQHVVDKMSKTDNTIDDITKISLFNTIEPQSAFHYCYGKNKRNYDGTAAVSNVDDLTKSNGTYTAKGWYMPGIRELETALMQYWNDFRDFQDKFYWSSACGICPYNDVWLILGTISVPQPNNMDNGYARATKVDANGNYVNSGIGDPGYMPRSGTIGGKSAVNRIRAFYRRN